MKATSLSHSYENTITECWKHYPFLYNEENYAGLKADIWNDESLSSLNLLAWPKEKAKPFDFEKWERIERFPEVEIRKSPRESDGK